MSAFLNLYTPSFKMSEAGIAAEAQDELSELDIDWESSSKEEEARPIKVKI